MIFNCIKSPKFNPAEYMVAYIKSLSRIEYYTDEYDLIQGIVDAFRQATSNIIINFCRHSFEAI